VLLLRQFREHYFIAVVALSQHQHHHLHSHRLRERGTKHQKHNKFYILSFQHLWHRRKYLLPIYALS
jgi:hypothetical protein